MMKSKNLRYGFFLALLLAGFAVAVASLKPGATEVEGMALSPDGKTLAVCMTSFDDAPAPGPSVFNVRHWIRFYDTSSWNYRDVEDELDGPVAFSPDGRYLATGDQSHYEGTVVLLWDTDRRRVITTIRGPADPTGDSSAGFLVPRGTRSLDFSPDGTRLVATGMNDPFARVWTVPEGEPVAAMQHEDGILEVRFAPDGRHLFTAGDDGSIRVWDYLEGELRETHSAHEGGVRVIEFSHDGKTLASGGRDGTLAIWDVDTMTPRHRLGGPNAEVEEIAFSPDDRTVAAGTGMAGWGMGGGSERWAESLGPDFSIALCSVAEGVVLSTLEGHSGHLSIVFSPDGTSLISGGSSAGMFGYTRDGTIRIWDVATGSGERLIRPVRLRIIPLVVCGLAGGLWLYFWIRGIRQRTIRKPFRTILWALGFLTPAFLVLAVVVMIWVSSW